MLLDRSSRRKRRDAHAQALARVHQMAHDQGSHTFAVQLSVLVSSQGHKAGALTLTLRVPHDLATGK